MHDFSLYVLDLIENSVRAGANKVHIVVEAKIQADIFEIIVEDNGSGLKIYPELATEPFYSTKDNKNIGLGLSLLRADVEQADGMLLFGRSPLGGLGVKALMRLRHIDRLPLGDIGATISSAICTNPDVDFSLSLVMDKREFNCSVSEVRRELKLGAGSDYAVAYKFMDKIRIGLNDLEIVTS